MVLKPIDYVASYHTVGFTYKVQNLWITIYGETFKGENFHV